MYKNIAITVIFLAFFNIRQENIFLLKTPAWNQVIVEVQHSSAKL